MERRTTSSLENLPVTAIDERAILRVLNRFANCFDTKQWHEMTDCLAADIYTDYSDLRGTPPETMSRTRFVELRREALGPLETHHLFANHEVEWCGDAAKAKVSAVIFRRAADGQTLHTHCLYLFELRREPQGWKICAITQKVLWSEGNPGIHAGIAQRR